MIFLKMREAAKKMFEASEDWAHQSDRLSLDCMSEVLNVEKVAEGVHEQYSHFAIWIDHEKANQKSKEMEEAMLGLLVKKINKHREVKLLLSKGRQLLLPLRNYYNDYESPKLIPTQVFTSAMMGYNEALRRSAMI
jgi:hypothetical protein